MSPATTAASTATRARTDRALRSPAPAPAPQARPPLRVVQPAPRRRRIRAARLLACSLVVGSLLSVVLGHSLLAQDQVRLTRLQNRLSTEQILHRQESLRDAGLETPSRITTQAAGELHMVPPGGVRQLPSVPLNVPLPPLRVLPAPAPIPAAHVPASPVPASPVPANPVPAGTATSG